MGSDLRCIVGGAVADHDQLDVGVRLREHALDGVRQIVCLVETGNDHRNQ